MQTIKLSITFSILTCFDERCKKLYRINKNGKVWKMKVLVTQIARENEKKIVLTNCFSQISLIRLR